MNSTGARFNPPRERNGEFARAKKRIVTRHGDPLYLFARHLEWRAGGSIDAYQDLIAALDDPNKDIRAIAEMLVRRSSPHP